jgi:glycosyltransferase involved in cell wall biosynthesis
MMRILHIIQSYPPARGGAETHFHEISRWLAARGHQVTVVTSDALHFELFWQPNLPRHQKREEIMDGVQVRRFPVQHLPGQPASYRAIRRLLWLVSRMRLPLSLSWQLARLTPRLPALSNWLRSLPPDFDIVAGMNITYESLLKSGLDYAREHTLPFVIYPLTHLGAGQTPGKDTIGQFYTMRHQLELVRQSQRLIAQTPSERDFYHTVGVVPNHIRVVGPGVHPDDIQGGDGARWREANNIHGPLVLALGSLTYDKGVTHLIEAMRLLWREGREATLVLAGRMLSPVKETLEALAPQERSHVHSAGPVDDVEKRDLLAACDLFALPSRVDSFGLVYLEAWLYQKPVVAANTWGVRDLIVQGETGMLVPFGDIQALAAAIRQLLDNPGQAAAMGAAGKVKVLSHHTWTPKLQRIEEIYRELA